MIVVYLAGVRRGRSRLVGLLGPLVGSRSGVGAVSSLGCGGVLGCALVRHVSDESTLVVSVVADCLHTAVGKVHLVRSLHNTVLILALLLVVVGAGVVVLDSVLVREGL